MRPVVISHANVHLVAPKKWDEETAGKCETLPVRCAPFLQSADSQTLQYTSAWVPSVDELRALIDGGCIVLNIISPTHPVVSVGVEDEDGWIGELPL